jgi:hypothetical protein
MKPIQNLLRQRLYRAQKPFIEHPPIDHLSAFAERALSWPDRAPVVDHLAHCGDCREIIFMAAPEVAHEVAAASGPAPRWVSMPAFRWASLAACAVVVVAAMRLHPAYKVVDLGTKLEAKVENSASLQRSQKLAPFVAPGAPEKFKSPVARAFPGKAKEVPESLRIQGNLSANLLPKSFSRNQPPRWTLTPEGTLQRSLDGGITWKKIPVSHDRVFRALASDGHSIWLGGQNGMLFHSTDAGKHWTKMKLDSPQATSDITSIQFDGPQNGKLSTAANEAWTTNDSGRTWQKQ